MYWALLVVSVAAEAVAAAHIAGGWVPAVPGWAWVAVFMSVFTVSNLAGVRNFGELEFWFAGLKIAAIAGFLLLGVVVLAGLLPGSPSPGAAHLLHDGGFLPHGSHGVAVGVVAAVFAFGGLETVTIAAAECEDPVRAVPAGVRAVMWRVAVCYLGSMGSMVKAVPWNAPGVADGPYAAVMDRIGVPGAADLMKAVVLVRALLSAMNANIYGSSRMLYALVGRGDAPASSAGWDGRRPPHRPALVPGQLRHEQRPPDRGLHRAERARRPRRARPGPRRAAAGGGDGGRAAARPHLLPRRRDRRRGADAGDQLGSGSVPRPVRAFLRLRTHARTSRARAQPPVVRSWVRLSGVAEHERQDGTDPGEGDEGPYGGSAQAQVGGGDQRPGGSGSRRRSNGAGTGRPCAARPC
ncbi:hypothetical protein STANM309S_04045 [Streptomyces tanashiensis]